MKHFVVLFVVYNNGTEDKKSLYMATSDNDAIRQVYKYMGQYTDAEGVASVMCEAKNTVGGTLKSEVWVAPTVEEPVVSD